MNVGQQIRKIRKEKGITLAQIGEALDISASALSQIENSKNTPSLETLTAVLKFMDVPMSDFFRQMEEPDVLVAKTGESGTIRSERGSRITLLASKLQNSSLESYSIELQPQAQISVKSLPMQANGERFVFVREGEVRILIDNAVHDLKKEDSINFKAHHVCAVTNVCAVLAQIIICGFPPVL
jgi:transcriptional regulator with XRE-family HTH domain